MIRNDGYADTIKDLSKALSRLAKRIRVLEAIEHTSSGEDVEFGDITIDGDMLVSDSGFKVFDDGDGAKQFRFEASGISSGNTRTLTIPDGDGTIAYSTTTSSNQAFSWMGF